MGAGRATWPQDTPACLAPDAGAYLSHYETVDFAGYSRSHGLLVFVSGQLHAVQQKVGHMTKLGWWPVDAYIDLGAHADGQDVIRNQFGCRSEVNGGRYTCSRADGHDGPHIASVPRPHGPYGSRIPLAVWWDRPER